MTIYFVTSTAYRLNQTHFTPSHLESHFTLSQGSCHLKRITVFLDSRKNTDVAVHVCGRCTAIQVLKRIQFCLINFVLHLHSESWLGEVGALFMHMYCL